MAARSETIFLFFISSIIIGVFWNIYKIYSGLKNEIKQLRKEVNELKQQKKNN